MFGRRELREYAETVVDTARDWRQQLDAIRAEVADVEDSDLRKARTDKIGEGWARFIQAKDVPIGAINESDELAESLVWLTLVADEASRGIGVTWDNRDEHGKVESSKFLSIAEQVLTDKCNPSYCLDVPVESLCVIGKQHTPMKGATFRSLPHHLTLYQPDEIKAIWILAPGKPVIGRSLCNFD